MRAGFIVTGVLGIGTALVFSAAALASAMFPNGATVSSGWGWNGGWDKGMVVEEAFPVEVDGEFAVPDGVPEK